jgi:hypothetical protein
MLLTIFSGSDRADHGGLPVGGQQNGQIILIGHGWQSFENVGQVGFRIESVTFGAFNQGVNDRSTLAGGFSADEEPVLFSNGCGTDAVFDEVVVDLDLAVLDEKGESVPEGEGVVDGAAEFSLGQNLGVLAQAEQLAFEDFENGDGLLLADGGTFGSRGSSLAQSGFDLIEFANYGDGASGETLADLESCVELAPGVRPTGGEVDAVLVGSPRFVSGVGVGLEVALIVLKQFVEAGGLAGGVPLIEDVALDAVAWGVDDPEVAGRGFAFAGIEVFDGSFVGLEVAGCQQAAVDEFVEGFEGVGDDFVPVAEGVARDVDAVAALEDAFGAVVGTVVAVFGSSDVCNETRRGSETQRGRRGGFDGGGVRVVFGDVDETHGAVDEDAAGLIVEAVGDDALKFAVGVGIGGGFVAHEDGLFDGQVGEVARLARGATFDLCGRFFSRRSGVCGRGGDGFFCRVGIERKFGLGGIDRLAAFIKQPGEHEIDLFTQELVLDARSFKLRAEPGDFTE